MLVVVLLLMVVVLVVIFTEAAGTGADRVTVKPRAGNGAGGREDDGRGQLVSVRGRGRRGPVQELNVLVQLRMVGHGGGGGGMLDAADQRIDEERPGHGLLGRGRYRHGRTGTVHGPMIMDYSRVRQGPCKRRTGMRAC